MPDEALHPLDGLLRAAGEAAVELVDEPAGVRMRVERARIEMPIELEVETDEQGRVVLAGSPPTQHVEATWFPVLHRIAISVGP